MAGDNKAMLDAMAAMHKMINEYNSKAEYNTTLRNNIYVILRDIIDYKEHLKESKIRFSYNKSNDSVYVRYTNILEAECSFNITPPVDLTKEEYHNQFMRSVIRTCIKSDKYHTAVLLY